MALSLKHTFQSAIADGGDVTIVQPSNWNAEHTITADALSVLGVAANVSGAIGAIVASSDNDVLRRSGTSVGFGAISVVNKVTVTAPTTSATLTIADGKTLTVSADATVSGTNTGDQTITLTGDVTGSGTGSFAATWSTAKDSYQFTFAI